MKKSGKDLVLISGLLPKKDDRNSIELLKSKYPFLLSTVELTGVNDVETIVCEILQQNDSICVTAEKYSCLREILGD